MTTEAVPGAHEDASPFGLGFLDEPLNDPRTASSFYHAKLTFETDPADVWEAMQKGETGFVVIDTRSRGAYAEGHVPGALSLPWREMSERTTAAIPKGKLIITYCNGIGCNASVKGAARMTTLGFRVKEMMGGLDWWKRNGQPAETAQDTPTCSASAPHGTHGAACGC